MMCLVETTDIDGGLQPNELHTVYLFDRSLRLLYMVQIYPFNDEHCPKMCKRGITRVSKSGIKSEGDGIVLITVRTDVIAWKASMYDE